MTTVAQSMSTQALSYGMGFEGIEATIFLVGMMTGVGGAVGEDVIFIGFLGVGIWTDLI